MNEITSVCQTFRKDFTPRPQDPRKPVRCWSEKDVLNGEIIDAYVIILRTEGCSWAQASGCTMCGYFNDSMLQPVSEQDLLKQCQNAMETYKGEKLVKIFTSGSFLDTKEIPKPVRNHLLSTLAAQAEKISVESRPSYVTETTLAEIKKSMGTARFEVGIGLETANDFIREKAINKGFILKDYTDAATLLRQQKMSVKTYVLLKPPFLTEQEALDDVKQTMKKIMPYTDIISVNPVTVQRNTLLEYLWKRDQYRPPWLWSVVESLKQKPKKDAWVKCDVTGGGSQRGAHNCGTCDHEILNAITKFSLTQNTSVFDSLDCDCKEQWKDQLELEALSFGSCIDMSRRKQ